jgi:hypothetical protein
MFQFKHGAFKTLLPSFAKHSAVVNFGLRVLLLQINPLVVIYQIDLFLAINSSLNNRDITINLEAKLNFLLNISVLIFVSG